MASTSSSLTSAVAQAISFLTRPLIAAHPPTAVKKLQVALEANLTALYAPSWDVQQPLQGSGRRCMTLSPSCLPPRALYSACLDAGVQWFEWIALLGGREFDFFVDPGRVSVRYASAGGATKLVTIWADEIPSPFPACSFESGHKTIAQQLLEHDNEEEIFALIADEVHGNAWLAPPANPAIPIRTSSPLSALSGHSRCSSRSSNSSSGLSLSSIDTSSPESSPSSKSRSGEQQRQSRRDRARQARVYVDTTKIEVTEYDGGKTTVLTGGVMLGGGKAKAASL
ncbi:hypothetical protein BDN72DRAFT_12427 [Pluteus cervinus]|uniref:Uncharacterized protein n=1 Tax=Pluteus cervinus TaxID=181527 RepID=A0ACD3BFN0_9AGAR|nr:hypothetical protein BDN72DRAFT_12427 [Pluteus cervinus]